MINLKSIEPNKLQIMHFVTPTPSKLVTPAIKKLLE